MARLREVATLADVFYHCGFWQAPGGYVGVDIFFVISDDLITGKRMTHAAMLAAASMARR